MENKIEILCEALLREYLKRKGYNRTYEAFEDEKVFDFHISKLSTLRWNLLKII